MVLLILEMVLLGFFHPFDLELRISAGKPVRVRRSKYACFMLSLLIFTLIFCISAILDVVRIISIQNFIERGSCSIVEKCERETKRESVIGCGCLLE